MLAFHNDKKIQKKYINRVKAHYKADEIVQGIYWENGKGCAVGCTIENDGGLNNDWHGRYEKALGVPRVLARLEDRIFEGLTNGEAKEFPLRFVKAINVGADLSLVFYKFMYWLLVDPKEGVIQYARPDGRKAIQDIADLFERKINGEDVDFERWMKARRAAAAAYAAYADAYADAAAAAYAAAAAAAYAAAAAAAAAAQKARSARFSAMAEKLISLLKEAK